jgi:hypothetical protein
LWQLQLSQQKTPNRSGALTMQEVVETDYEVFVSGIERAIGAVREVSPGGRSELIVYVENAGEFVVPADAIADVQGQKVMLDSNKLEPRLQQAICHAHDAEQPLPDGSG